MTPAFKVVSNRTDITDIVGERFVSLRLTDETGTESDTFELTLADHRQDQPLNLPPVGAELDISIGYVGNLSKMGRYVVDEIALEGPPSQMTIRGRAAVYETSKGGQTDLQTQKTRSWKKDTSIKTLVDTIAREHGLTAKVSSKLANIKLPHTDQSCESDLNLLLRLAKRYDAICKPANGILLFTPKGDAQSAGGQAMTSITLTPEHVATWSVTIAAKESAGTCVAYYRDNKQAKRYEVRVGEGDPVRQLRMQYKDRDSAEAAAQADMRKRAREDRKLELTLVGRADVIAETTLNLSGFREGVNGLWLVARAEHIIDTGGYQLSVSAELPNSEIGKQSPGANAAQGGSTSGKPFEGSTPVSALDHRIDQKVTAAIDSLKSEADPLPQYLDADDPIDGDGGFY